MQEKVNPLTGGILRGFNNPIPKQEDIDRVVGIIEHHLATIKQLNMSKNFGVKEGYTRLVENLKENKCEWKDLKTVQGKALASLADDYRKGLCSEEVLLNVPIKMR